MYGIIFDFNRTLYDIDAGTLYPKTMTVLHACQQIGAQLFLISAAGPGRRRRITELGLDPFFADIIVTCEKSQATFIHIRNTWPAKHWVVIGDRIKREITYGNGIDATTIWVRHGRFADEGPTEPYETPNYTVQTVSDVLPIISLLTHTS